MKKNVRFRIKCDLFQFENLSLYKTTDIRKVLEIISPHKNWVTQKKHFLTGTSCAQSYSTIQPLPKLIWSSPISCWTRCKLGKTAVEFRSSVGGAEAWTTQARRLFQLKYSSMHVRHSVSDLAPQTPQFAPKAQVPRYSCLPFEWKLKSKIVIEFSPTDIYWYSQINRGSWFRVFPQAFQRIACYFSLFRGGKRTWKSCCLSVEFFSMMRTMWSDPNGDSDGLFNWT